MSEFMIEVQGGATVRLPTGGKYCPRDILVTGKGGDTEAAYNEGYEIGAKEGAEVGYNRGKQEEYDRFWDAYQENGKRTNYDYAFYGPGWTDETFKPKYDMVNIVSLGGMFSYSNISDLKGLLDNLGIAFDTSNAVSAADLINNCATTTCPTIDCIKFSANTNLFRFAKKLQTASLVNVQATQGWVNAFASCGELVNLSITGTIGKNIAPYQCAKLSDASIQNIIDCLADLTGQTAQTVTFHKDVGGRLTQAQKDTISAKNWTLAY